MRKVLGLLLALFFLFGTAVYVAYRDLEKDYQDTD